MDLTFNRSDLIDIEIALNEAIRKREQFIMTHSDTDENYAAVVDELDSMKKIKKRIQTVKI